MTWQAKNPPDRSVHVHGLLWFWLHTVSFVIEEQYWVCAAPLSTALQEEERGEENVVVVLTMYKGLGNYPAAARVCY